MKVTLQVNGREMTFSEQELIAIVEKHFSSKATNQESATNVAQKPTVGKWFEVKPQAIDQKLFENEREDKRQEETRQIILEAFEKMKNNPEKYGRNFKTMMPNKDWTVIKTVEELKEIASKLGDHNANYVEQALEWAQRIANGESWESICNNADTTNWYRLVVWKDGYTHIIGGSANDCNDNPASAVGRNYSSIYGFRKVVPLVVLYEK